MNRARSWFLSREAKERKRSESFEPTLHDSHGHASDPTTEETIRRIQRHLPKLSEKLREVLILCGFEGHSYEEASLMLKLPVGTIRSRLNAARLKLRELLEEEEI